MLFLYHNDIALTLAKRLEQCGHEVVLWPRRIEKEDLQQILPERIISYTYRYIITKEIIQWVQKPILNLHISYLPWNRGADPNFWSFVENSPKGVTIHEVDEGIDSGKILLQKRVSFEEKKETFDSSYQKLNELIVELFMENSTALLEGSIQGVRSQEQGSYHRKQDRTAYLKNRLFAYDMTISSFKENMMMNGSTI